jgi:uncharacterized protein (TIGR02246 family)
MKPSGHIKEVPMRRPFLSTLRASLAAIPAVLLAVSTACNEESDAIGPRAADQLHPAPQADLGAIPTDPILDIISAETAAWAAKDAAAYAASYAEDLRFINPAGVVFLGRDAFRNLHVALFNGPFAGSTLAIAVREIQFLTGTIAIVYLDETLTGYAFLPPGVPSSGGVVHTRVTWVVEKRGGEWQVVFQHITPQL